MPFGLQVKSLIVGVLFAMFVLPWIMGMLGGRRNAAANA